MSTTFIDCSSINISYDIMGIATINFTVLSDSSGWPVLSPSMALGGVVFNGYIANASLNRMPNTEWYETHATLIATST